MIQERYALGECDVVVDGGGAAGIMEAVRQSLQGQKVVIIEPRGSLLWEITRAKQNLLRFPGPIDCSVLSSLLSFLQQQQAVCSDVQGELLEPCMSEIAIDRWMSEHGIRVLHQAKVLASHEQTASHEHSDHCSGSCSSPQAVIVALKGQLGELRATRVLRPSSNISSACRLDAARHPYSIWTLTLFDCPTAGELHTAITINGHKLPLRLRQGYHLGESYADIAYPTPVRYSKPVELLFARDMEAIISSIRLLGNEWQHAKLAHLCDEPWIPELAVADPVHFLGDASGAPAETAPKTFWNWSDERLAALFL
jgi:hypothetical protein